MNKGKDKVTQEDIDSEISKILVEQLQKEEYLNTEKSEILAEQLQNEEYFKDINSECYKHDPQIESSASGSNKRKRDLDN